MVTAESDHAWRLMADRGTHLSALISRPNCSLSTLEPTATLRQCVQTIRARPRSEAVGRYPKIRSIAGHGTCPAQAYLLVVLWCRRPGGGKTVEVGV